jgi:hypothetical protein
LHLAGPESADLRLATYLVALPASAPFPDEDAGSAAERS